MRLRISKLGCCAGECDFIVSGIDFDEHLPRLHFLIVFDVDFGHVTADPRADLADVAVNLSIIGSFISARVEPPEQDSNRGND